ncbi:MAG: DNA/RNA non-specific endonuclease [Flavobacteriaceae bacterium]
MFTNLTQHTNSGNSTLLHKEKDSSFIQPKLNVGKSGEQGELETATVTDQVVAKNNLSPSSFLAPNPAVQKQVEEDVKKQDKSNEIQQQPILNKITSGVQLNSDSIHEKSKEEEGQTKEDEEIQEKEEVVQKMVTSVDGDTSGVEESSEEPSEKTTIDIVEKSDTAAEKGKEKAAKAKEKKATKGKKKRGGGGGASVTTTPRNPKDDPNFKKLETGVDKTSKEQQSHEDSKTSAGAAQSAAVSPDNERLSTAQSGQVKVMDAAKPGTFNAAAFKAKLMKRIAGMQLPKNQDEAANFDKNNNIEEINNSASNDVQGEKAAAAGSVEQTTKQEPNVEAVPKREVIILPEAPIGEKPAGVNSSNAMPPKRGEAEVSKPLQENMSEVDQQMAENEVTDEQLAKSNEPSFMKGLKAKSKAKKNTKSAPAQLRKKEEGILQDTKTNAEGKEQTGLKGMHQERSKLLNQVAGDQTKTGKTDTTERTRIATAINKIYEKSKTDVEKILNDLDEKVKNVFKVGTIIAKMKFELHVLAKMRAYKSRRYSGAVGKALWLKDKLAGMPDEVNNFFVTGRKVYIDSMDKVITNVAKMVATKLTEAKTRVAKGKKEVHEYVKALPDNLKKIGNEAAEEINDKFDELEDSVNNKQDQLVDSLAEQYMEGLNSVDARIEEMKAANRGLIDAALGFINGIIETIKKLKELISKLLAEIQSAMGVIMQDPIGFVKTLFGGIKKGIDLFMANIQKHLLGGFVTWLTGAMGPVGITIPDNLFSLPGIFNLVMQVLGLSWDYMRKKSVLLIGEPVVQAMETGFEMFQTIRKKGVAGIWEHVKEQFTDLKETIIESIKSMLITQVIEAGIKWLLSLLIPGAGFVKAIMAIKDLIVFFVESAIMLIPSLIKAIKALAAGNVGGVAKAVEKGLAMLIPLVIGLFAKLIGLGGLVKKVQKIIKKVRKRIDRAITKLIKKAKAKFNKIVSKKKPKKGAAKKIKEDNKKGKPDKITSKDKAKHKKIAAAIQKKLNKKSGKKHKDFTAFYKEKKGLAKSLENKYQPQLKKGINLDIKSGSLAKEKKDNDIDFKIKIYPNDENQTAEVVYEDGQDITNLSLVAELEKLPASADFDQIKGVVPKLNGIVKKESLDYEFTRITLESGSDKTHFVIKITEIVKTRREDDKRKKDTTITKVGTIKIKRETKTKDSVDGAPDINEFLVKAKEKDDGSKKATIDKALKLHKKLRKVEKKAKISDLSSYISDLNELSVLLSKLSDVEQDLPDTTYDFQQDSQGKAIKAEAKKLSTKTGPGTAPEANIIGWNFVTGSLNKGTHKLWVRLHLINEKKFGGRGGSSNLVPGTKNNNSHHLASFENKLKKWLDAKEEGSYRVAGLEADVSRYGANQFDNSKHHHENVKTESGDLPKSEWYSDKITFSSKEYVEKSGSWEKGSKNAVDPLTLNIPLPNFDAANVPALPTIDGKTLLRIATDNGVSETLIKKAQVKNFLRREVFSNDADFATKLENKKETYGISDEDAESLKTAISLMIKPGILTY